MDNKQEHNLCSMITRGVILSVSEGMGVHYCIAQVSFGLMVVCAIVT